MERLQKVIANRGYASRRSAEKLILDGKVFVNGEKITELGYKVSGNEEITVNGEAINRQSNEYYLLYKPVGVISSANDEKKRKTVVDMIDTKTRIYPVGRLDYNTSGIILLTNDGDLTNGLLHPKKEVEKKYVAKVRGIISIQALMSLKKGVVIDDKKTSPAKVKVRSKNNKNNVSIVEITIHEGFNHQVRKMFEAFGYEVLELKRVSFADLTLDGLKKGEYRSLTPKEVKVLYSMMK